jgi:SAM-dependent methyltransferase
MIFHHLSDPDQAVNECRRVLRPGGVVCLRETTANYIDTFPYVPFFPESRRILKAVLPSHAYIRSIFGRAGFQLLRHELVRSEAAANWDIYGQKIGCRAISMLAQLADDDFEEGLAALRAHAAGAPTTGPVIELMDFYVFRLD